MIQRGVTPRDAATIVVAFDGSPGARGAAALGAALAARWSTRLLLAHGGELTGDEQTVAGVLGPVRAQLAAERRALLLAPASVAIESVRVGRAHGDVPALLDECSAELLIVGVPASPDRRRIERDSLAGALLASEAVAALVVPASPVFRAPGATVFERPLALVDKGETSCESEEAVGLLADGAGSDLLYLATCRTASLIADFVASRGYDLVVGGEVTRALVEHLACPVLRIPTRGEPTGGSSSRRARG